MAKINKPLGAQLADYVRGDLSIIAQKNKLLKDYETELINKVFEEADTNNLRDAVIYLVENYHPYRKLIKKQGRVFKWSKELQVMLAVWVEMRPDGITIDEEIDDMLSKPYWRALVKAGNKKEVDGAGILNYHRKVGRRSAFFEYEKQCYQNDPEKWVKTLASRLKVYGDKTIS